MVFSCNKIIVFILCLWFIGLGSKNSNANPAPEIEIKQGGEQIGIDVYVNHGSYRVHESLNSYKKFSNFNEFKEYALVAFSVNANYEILFTGTELSSKRDEIFAITESIESIFRKKNIKNKRYYLRSGTLTNFFVITGKHKGIYSNWKSPNYDLPFCLTDEQLEEDIKAGKLVKTD